MNNRTLVVLHPHFLKPGGASNVVLEQISRLAKMGMRHVIITTKVNREVIKPYPNLKYLEIGDKTTGSLWFWITFPLFYLKLQKELDRIENKLLYCHSLAIYWGAAYKLFHPKAITINYIHDLGMPYTDSDPEISGLPLVQRLAAHFTRGFFRLINRGIISSADYLIANSRTSADYIYKIYSRKVDTIVSPGVDQDIFKPSTKKGDYVFTVGRLEKIKNIDLIVRGFSLYKSSHPKSKLKLVIVGEGIEKDNLLRLASILGSENSVIFSGRLNPVDLAKVASKAKLGIFMCPNESFGLGAIESMACGTPVIGVNQNGIREIVNASGGLLMKKSPRSLKKRLGEILSHRKLLKEMSSRASYCAKKYDWNTQGDALYSWLIKLTK